MGDSTDLQTLHRVKAHDVRALSASLALYRAVALRDIMDAAEWRCHNTFTDFYLRDFSVQNHNVLHLAPLVGAQQVTFAPTNV